MPLATPAPRVPVHTWAARFGELVFAVDLPARFGPVRRPWHGPFGLPPLVRFTVEPTDAPFEPDKLTEFDQLDRDEFAFWSPSCHGHASWVSGQGHLQLHDQDRTASARAKMLQEALFAACYAWLLPRGGLLLHAATLWIHGQVFVVAGPSTAGKTTLCERFTPQWWSDEHAFLAREGDAWFVLRHIEFRAQHGDFPWRAPLAGLLWLGPERGHSAVQPLQLADALTRIMPQALVAGPPTSTPVLDAVAHLCQHVPVAELSHCLDTPVAELAERIAGARHAAG